MTHEEVGELLAAYALNAVSQQERDEVETHLKTCRTCTAEVEQLLAVPGQLALLAVEQDPPPALRTRLMNLIERDRELWLQQVAVQAPPAKPWWQRVPRLVYGMGGVAVVALVLLVAVLATRNTVTVHTYRSGVVAQHVVIRGVNVGGASAAIGVRSDHTTQVTFSGLPTLPPAFAYELWLIPARGAPVSLGGFHAGSDHAFDRRYDKDAAHYAVAAVTIEKAPGNWPAPSPNSIILTVNLSA